ncbi:hypothetical protein SH528x_001467 [Novipirellula sp. SH528]|uniref:hypothetical protein n=1 Tax=Novipirellula sp. SH528 TaxID=3454466 RepID=UPI003F9FC11C
MNDRQRLGKPSDNGLMQGDFDSRMWDRRIVALYLFVCPPIRLSEMNRRCFQRDHTRD